MHTSEKYYSELDDISLYNWDKLLSGDLRYISKKPTKTITESMSMAFESLYNKYLATYGVSDKYQEYIDIKRQLIELRIAFIQTGDTFLLNQIEIEQSNLERLMKEQEDGMTIADSLTILGRHFGRWIEKKDITVEGYEALKKDYGRANKKG